MIEYMNNQYMNNQYMNNQYMNHTDGEDQGQTNWYVDDASQKTITNQCLFDECIAIEHLASVSMYHSMTSQDYRLTLMTESQTGQTMERAVSNGHMTRCM